MADILDYIDKMQIMYGDKEPRSMDQEPRIGLDGGGALTMDVIRVLQDKQNFRDAWKNYKRSTRGSRPLSPGQFFKIWARENMATGGSAGQLVQPNDDGSRPGYNGDNKYTSSKGTPGVKLDAKQIKNVQDDLVNFDGLSLTKKGNSYYIRFRLQKGKNKISKQVTATPENIALVKKEQKQFMKTNYPNVLSSANFENLRMQETNINLSAKDFAEVLNNKNKTTINGLPWTKDTVQKLQGDLKLNSYVQPGGASGKLRPINDAKKIVRGFNPEELKRLNQIPDINLRNAAIRSKASSITGRISYIKKTGTLQGITKNNQGSLWKNFYESSKKNNRITLGGTFNGKDLSFRKNWPKKADGTIDWFIKDKKTNKPAWQMLEFTDTQTPKGPTTFTYEGLQNQVDDAFGKGYFARSTNVYSKSRELYGTNIMFEGKMQPVGRVIAKQRIINDFKKNNNGKMPTEEYINKRITTSTPTQVHHTKGIGNDPYSVQLVSRDANQKLNAAELTYTSELKKAKGDSLKIKTLNDNFKKTVNQISDTYGGIQYDVDGSVIGKKATPGSAYTSALNKSFNIKTPEGRLNIKKQQASVTFQKFLKDNGIVVPGCGRQKVVIGGRITFSNGTCGGFKNADEFAKGDPENFLKTIQADSKAAKAINNADASVMKSAFNWAKKDIKRPTGWLGGDIAISTLFTAGGLEQGQTPLEALDQGLLWFLPEKILNSYKKGLTEGMNEQDTAYIKKALDLETADKNYFTNKNELDSFEKQLKDNPKLFDQVTSQQIKNNRERLTKNIEDSFNYGSQLYEGFGDFERTGKGSDLPYIEGVTSNAPTDKNFEDGYTNAMNKLFEAKKQKAVTGSNISKQYDLGREYQKYLNDIIMPDFIEKGLGKTKEGLLPGKPILDRNYQDYDILGDKSSVFTDYTPSLARPFAPVTATIGRLAGNYANTKLPFSSNVKRYLENIAVSRGKENLTIPTTMDNLTQQDFDILNQYQSGIKRDYAGGGIAGLSGGDPEGAMTKSMNPDSQGLRSLYKNGNKL